MEAADLSGSLVDLLIALAAQRHDFEWPAASQSIQSLLASGCQLEGLYVVRFPLLPITSLTLTLTAGRRKLLPLLTARPATPSYHSI